MIQRFGTKRRQTAQSALTKGLRVVSITGLVGISLLGLVNCDTVADISFSERRFQEIRPAGFSSPAGMCDGTTGDLSFRFVLMANDNTPIQPGETVDLREVHLTRDDLSFSSARVFSLPDEYCEDAQQGMCPNTFVCSPGNETMTSNFKRCNTTTDLSVKGHPDFVADTQRHQLFGVVYSNAGSLRGWLPQDLGELYPINDEGQVIGQRDTGPDNSRATDLSKYRRSALNSMVDNWRNAATNALNTNRQTRFGLWSYAGSVAQVRSYISDDSGWTRQPGEALAASGILGDSDPTRSRANTYEALKLILEQGYADQAYENMDKTMVVFVDGPDEMRDDVEPFVTRAKELGVKVFIVHLDAPVNVNRLRDDHRYYRAQQSPCDSDSECKNFEECRKPAPYRLQQEGTGADYPTTYAENPDAQYCLPKRDVNGRVGPIFDYSRIACETEGGYMYIPSAKALPSRMSWLPFVMDGLWEVDVDVAEVNRGVLNAGDPFKLQSTLRVELSGEARAYSFSQLGDQTAAADDDDASDTRPVFFVAP